MDTSGFYAAATRRDTNFPTAQRIIQRAGRTGTLLVATSYIVAEAHALFLSREGRDAGVRFLRRVEAGAVNIIKPSEADEAVAREIIYRYTDKSFSLTDAISFAVMERLDIATAFTFDSDFRQYGFAVAEG